MNLENLNSSADNQTLSNGSAKTSGSVGVSFGTDGLLVNLSTSKGRGKADGADTTYSNTQIKASNSAGNAVTLRSGGDTMLKGAVIAANTVRADIGGDLNIESLRDTSTYTGKQQNAGGSLSIGYVLPEATVSLKSNDCNEGSLSESAHSSQFISYFRALTTTLLPIRHNLR